MKVRDIFNPPVDRHIAPVVYLHEQDPKRLADEVKEYIFTPGIHEQMVNLLRQLKRGLDDPGLAELPACWISGFYGSGKSSFAKLVGLALGGFRLPGDRLLADALAGRDDTPRTSELRDAWAAVTSSLPQGALSVVFDIGGEARDNDHVDKVALRCLRRTLGYCPVDAVAIEEMKLEAAGQWDTFRATAQQVLGRPWEEAAVDAFASEDFSEVIHNLAPSRYIEPMSWHSSHMGRAYDASGSMADSIEQLKMLQAGRARGRHIFFVIDEVSQYIIRPTVQSVPMDGDGSMNQDPKDRMLRLQTFISALGQHFRGRVWLFALGQEKLDQAESDSPLGKMRDRFPPHLRVHLDAANIHDVVTRRLLRKGTDADASLRQMWREHGARLKLYAWTQGGRLEEGRAEARFVDTYPLLPDHVGLLLEISSGLRAASHRVQTDAASVRGLLQLIQELFRQGSIGDAEVPALLTLDEVYDVQRSGLPNDQALTMAAISREHPVEVDPANDLLQRVAKAVVMLGYQRARVTDEMIARLLYRRAGDDTLIEGVRASLARLTDGNYITFSEEKGYRLQDAAGQEWEAERKQQPAGNDQVVERLLGHVVDLFTVRAKLEARAMPLELIFTAGTKYLEHRPQTRREDTTVPVDLRLVPLAGAHEHWTKQSNEPPLRDRFVWLVPFQSGDGLFLAAQELERSDAMVRRYKSVGVPQDKRYLLLDEEKRKERLATELKDALKGVFYRGAIYFRGERIPLSELRSVEAVVSKVIEPHLRDLYPYYRDIAVTQRDMDQLLARDLPAAPSEKFFADKLGLLRMDAGSPSWAPEGEAPKAILRHIEEQRGCNGGNLMQHFARPPYGYAPDVVRACLVALFRAERIVFIPESGKRLTSRTDEGFGDLFQTDRALKNTHVQLREKGKIGPRELVAIRGVLEGVGEKGLSTDRDKLTDAIFRVLTVARQRLRGVEDRLRTLPVFDAPHRPDLFVTLTRAMDECSLDRRAEHALETFHKHLETFQTGFALVRDYDEQLTKDALDAVRGAAETLRGLGSQLIEAGERDEHVFAAIGTVQSHLERSRPWRDHGDLDDPLSLIRATYRAERTRRAAQRTQEAEVAREALKREAGFDKLSPDQATDVLAPLFVAGDSVDLDAVAPTLAVLDRAWPDELRRADIEARDRMHRALHPRIPVHDVAIRARVLKSPQDVDEFVEDLKTRLLAELADGRRHVRVKVSG